MKKLIFIVAALLCIATHSNAQIKTFKSTYSLASDTTVDAGTTYLTSPAIPGPGKTTIQVVVTKISGTVGGTISLQGSLDGTNFKALTTEETQTALATITATDASNVYAWRLSGNPFTYYRVSWTGTGTMSASFTAKSITH
jgi:hypothetical protein